MQDNPNTITVTFKFSVGDLVYFSGATHNVSTVPIQAVITERIAQQCHGGIQQLYKVSSEQGLFSEVSLCLEEPPYRKRCKEYQDEMAEERQIRSWASWVKQGEAMEEAAENKDERTP